MLAIATLRQGRFFNRRTLALNADCLEIETRNSSRIDFVRIPIEHVPVHPRHVVLRSRGALWLSLVAGFAAFMEAAAYGWRDARFLWAAALTLLCGGAYVFERREYYVFSGNQTFSLRRDQPSRAAVDEFLAALSATREKFIAERDSILQEARPVTHELERLARLHRLGYIRDEEYELLKDDLIEHHTAAPSDDAPPN